MRSRLALALIRNLALSAAPNVVYVNMYIVHICGSMPLVVMCLFGRILEYPAARLI